MKLGHSGGARRVEPLLLRIERSQLRWLGHLFRMPPGRLPREVFQVGMSHREEAPGRPRTRWRDYVSRLAWERLGVPPGRARRKCLGKFTPHQRNEAERFVSSAEPLPELMNNLSSAVVPRPQTQHQKCQQKTLGLFLLSGGPKAFPPLPLHLADSRRFRQLVPLPPDSIEPPNAIIQQLCPTGQGNGRRTGENEEEKMEGHLRAPKYPHKDEKVEKYKYGEAPCSHNAVVIPPAHGALAPVNTLPIVSWTSFIPSALWHRRAHGLWSWTGFILYKNQESTSELRFITGFKEICGNKRKLSKPHLVIMRNLGMGPEVLAVLLHSGNNTHAPSVLQDRSRERPLEPQINRVCLGLNLRGAFRPNSRELFSSVSGAQR
ncbi:hypothetical protein L3Q82_008328 [Scortum barcoo]|uniref:Uncharacterized protein n=1 Tax=Scortum barcoo TaxID=214431 RepID=A0ACB8WKU2_9TELE|nr:hypothetical protein L3Q82_008328 [Scortum barcoo]